MSCIHLACTVSLTTFPCARRNLGFLLSDGPHDQAAAWAALDPDTRRSLKDAYSRAVIAIVVSAFRETDSPAGSGVDPAALAQAMANWVIAYGMDGIDVDWEETTRVTDPTKRGVGEAWLATFNQTLRQTLPQGQFILSHAPLAPWLSPNAQFAAGAYLTIHRNVGALIDFVRLLSPSCSGIHC